MIIYDLICEHEHSFEGWFKSTEDYNRQLAEQMLCCPMCESSQVRKVPTASFVVTRDTHNSRNSASSESMKPIENNVKQQTIAKLSQLASYLIKNTEDVGRNFTEETKKMHYGETEQKSIRGQATLEEVKEMNEEGIDIIALPGTIIEKDKLN